MSGIPINLDQVIAEGHRYEATVRPAETTEERAARLAEQRAANEHARWKEKVGLWLGLGVLILALAVASALALGVVAAPEAVRSKAFDILTLLIASAVSFVVGRGSKG